MAPWQRQIWFDGPDEAYLVSAAIARHVGGEIVRDVTLVPSARGPALLVSDAVAGDPLVQALVRRFGGHIDAVEVADRLRERYPERLPTSGDRP